MIKVQTAIRPDLSWNAKLGISALRQHLGALASAVGDDERAAELTHQAIWLAEKVLNDIDAAHQNADEVSTSIRLEALRAV